MRRYMYSAVSSIEVSVPIFFAPSKGRTAKRRLWPQCRRNSGWKTNHWLSTRRTAPGFIKPSSPLSTHATLARVRLLPRDFVSALVVFVLVSTTALPGVIPFLVLEDSYLALRLSSLVLILLLFLVGYWWGHYTDGRPWRLGLTVMLLGISMVLVAVALGG